MSSYPIETIDLNKAKEFQFKLVDLIQREFRGDQFLQAGDYGLVPGKGKPAYTEKVERVLARFFQSEACALVRGAGTGALRSVLNAKARPGQRILIHAAPIYPTTKVIMESMGLKIVSLDFNRPESWERTVVEQQDFCLIQHTRQKLDDRYELAATITRLKQINPALFILVDDNYAVMKAEKIGIQTGGDASAFSLFKLLGPEGVGCVLADQATVDEIERLNYSGGSQVQGPEAMEALRSLVFAPVMLALQKEAADEAAARINAGEVAGVKSAFIANAQSRVILVEFDQPIAKQVLKQANRLGAAPYPVGAESRYEIAAMFYRVSGTFLAEDPQLEDYMIRINPMRAGADTILRLLQEAVRKANLRGG